MKSEKINQIFKSFASCLYFETNYRLNNEQQDA